MADADALNKEGESPGHEAMKGLAYYLATELECTVRIALGPVEWESDVADWLEERGVDETAKLIHELLVDYTPEDAQGDDRPQLNERMLARGFTEHTVCGDKWRFDEHAALWRAWDGARWEVAKLEIIDDVGQYMFDTYHSLEEGGDSGLRRWQSRAAIMNVKDLARVYAAQEFDLDPGLVGLPWNAVLDTRTAKETVMLRDHFVTRCLPDSIVKPGRQHKGTAEWVTFLRESLSYYRGSDHEDVYHFIQMWAATALAGDCSSETMLYLVGPPNSGKGTVGEVLLALFGAYSHTLDVARVVGEQMHHLQWKAQLLGKRFVYVDELRDKGPWRADVLDPIISGAEIEAQHMRQESFKFKSVAHLLATGNHEPNARAAGGIWRRLCIIRFTNEKALDERDEGLKARLRGDLYPVYLWVLEGLRRWIQNGRKLHVPAVLVRESAEAKIEADPYALFVSECLERDPDAYVPMADLYQVLGNWWSKGHGTLPTKHTASQRLTELGFPTVHKGREGRCKQGVRILQERLMG